MLYLCYVVFVGLLSGVLFYIKAIQYGLPATRWGLTGLVSGPLFFPLLHIERQLALLRNGGLTSTILRA